MKRTVIFLYALFITLVTSCAYDSEDDLIVVEEEGQEENTKPTGVTYEGTLKAIIQSNCLGCHTSPPRNGAPFSLVNYTQVSNRAELILNAISRQSGTPAAMPPPGRMPQNTIEQFREWIENGKPEN